MKWMRIIQLVLRCLEILCAIGLLVLMILIKGVDAGTSWIMKIVVGGHTRKEKKLGLTSPSLELLFSIRSTESTILEGSTLEGLRDPQHHTTCSLRSSTYP